ncbi:MAG: HAD family hydrolase [Deltaproteobacteria bacterium]|nr:HAD family hydrolase [Deltaproteobacteria bacterium]
MNRAVFLDRDGVINEVVFRGSSKPIAPWSLEEFKFIPGIEKPLRELSQMGYLLFVVSNQPDIAKGRVKAVMVEKMNKKIMDSLPIREILICPHDDSHHCLCRKPKPGMLLDLAHRWAVGLDRSYLIGDNWKDMEAGKAAGCRTILIDGSYNKDVKVTHRVKDIKVAVTTIQSIERQEYRTVQLN